MLFFKSRFVFVLSFGYCIELQSRAREMLIEKKIYDEGQSRVNACAGKSRAMSCDEQQRAWWWWRMQLLSCTKG